jgi:arginine decarboxylase
MWELPQAVTLAAGAGEGGSEINAFDRALQNAGVADMNFLRVTSIFPRGARIIEVPPYPAGVLMPAVFARMTSTRPGDRISAAIGIGISRDSHGVIMEHAGILSRADAERAVRRMVAEAFENRRLTLSEVLVAAAEHTVERAGCAVAVALLWPHPAGLG